MSELHSCESVWSWSCEGSFSCILRSRKNSLYCEAPLLMINAQHGPLNLSVKVCLPKAFLDPWKLWEYSNFRCVYVSHIHVYVYAHMCGCVAGEWTLGSVYARSATELYSYASLNHFGGFILWGLQLLVVWYSVKHLCRFLELSLGLFLPGSDFLHYAMSLVLIYTLIRLLLLWETQAYPTSCLTSAFVS